MRLKILQDKFHTYEQVIVIFAKKVFTIEEKTQPNQIPPENRASHKTHTRKALQKMLRAV